MMVTHQKAPMKQASNKKPKQEKRKAEDFIEKLYNKTLKKNKFDRKT